MPTLVLLTAVGTWLGFANPLFQIPLLALALPLGLAAIAFRAQDKGHAFKTGWLAGTLACCGVLYWLVVPVAIYGNLPWYIALPCPLLAGAALGLYYALFCFILYYAAQKNNGALLYVFSGLLWMGMEQLMNLLFTSFPWMNLAAAFAPWPIFTQLASVAGAFGLSGILTALAIAGLLANTTSSAKWFCGAGSIALLLFGFWALETQHPQGKPIPIALIQGNVDQSLKWNPEYQLKTIEQYLALSRKTQTDTPPALIVWPETAMPFYLQDSSSMSFMVKDFANTTKTAILTGSPAYRITNPAQREYVLLNRATLLHEMGKTEEKYDKEHLVPFGEYMPFKDFLPFEKLVTAAGNFVPGTKNTPLTLDGTPFGVLICYEAIFPELAQKQVANGAQFLTNISNDAWFGKTAAPRQHLALTRMRAIEQGRWIARSTNTGISCFIDPQGRIHKQLPQFSPEQGQHTIAALQKITIFHKLSSWLWGGCFLFTIAFLCWIFFPAAKKTQTKQIC